MIDDKMTRPRKLWVEILVVGTLVLIALVALVLYGEVQVAWGIAGRHGYWGYQEFGFPRYYIAECGNPWRTPSPGMVLLLGVPMLPLIYVVYLDYRALRGGN